MSSSRRDSSPTWIPRSGDRASRRNVNPVTLHRSRASIFRQSSANIGAAAAGMSNHILLTAYMLFLKEFFESFLSDRGRSRASPDAHRMCIFAWSAYLTHFESYVFRTKPSNTMQTLGGLAHRIHLQSSVNTQLQFRDAAPQM